MTDAWPISILSPFSLSRRIMPRTLQGNSSLSGYTQRVSVPAQAWRIRYDGIPVHTAEQIRTWDALEATLEGGAVPILVPLLESDRQPAITAAMDADAAIGATTVAIERLTGTDAILAGHHFSIGERLYRVATVVSEVAGVVTVTIMPPLREAVLAAAAVSFATLRVKCRLADENGMSLTLQPPGYGFVAIEFVEDPQ